MPNSMMSLVLTAPNKLEMRERQIREPGPMDALVKVFSVGVCHTDIETLTGVRADTRYPTVLGHEFSGIVVKCGEGVGHVKPGDRVASMGWAYCGVCHNCRRGRHNGCPNIVAMPFHIEGANQEYVVIPAVTLFPMADTTGMDEGALAEPAANALAVVERAQIFPGERVVVIGPGAIGLMAINIAASKQPKALVAVGTRRERLEPAVRLGATHTVNVRETDPYEGIMAATDGFGADAVMICGGGQEAWELAGKVIAHYGRIILEAAPEEWESRYPVWIMGMLSKHASYSGMCGFTGSEFKAALDMIESGGLQSGALITNRFPLSQAEEAFETSNKRKDGAIKVIIRVAEE